MKAMIKSGMSNQLMPPMLTMARRVLLIQALASTPDALWRKNDKERELMLLEAAKHIKMAWSARL